MARSNVELPTGVELRNGAIRLRFTFQGKRCSETLPYPATKEGIASASRLRDQVVSLNKLGLLDETKYAELFPQSAKASEANNSTFGVYTQSWLNSREIVQGTRGNYKSILNTWWMPKLATTQISVITPALMRRLISEIEWVSPGVKRRAMGMLSTILASVVSDGLLAKNPMAGLDLPKAGQKKVDPFTVEEANQIIEYLYLNKTWATSIMGAYFEFAFYTGMRPSEIMALRWDEVDLVKKTAHVCRIVANTEIKERTKTNKARYVLLNDRALHALAFARQYIDKRISHQRELKEFPYCFPPSKNTAFTKKTSILHQGWREMLEALGYRYRPPYNARHTYATMCLMAGMQPAFIAGQLGHSVQMLLSTYTKWLNNESDWEQMEKLTTGPRMPQGEE